MGRPKGAKNKPRVNLSQEDQENLTNGSITPEELASKYQTDTSKIYQIKRKAQLKTDFVLAPIDPAIPTGEKTDFSQNGSQNDSQTQTQTQGEPLQVVNYDALVSAFWGGVDSVSSLMAFVSRGQIEYKPLTKEEIDRLTQSSKGNSIIQKLSSVDQMSNLILLGTIAVIFKDRFKLKRKHNDKDPKCKCDKCKIESKEEKPETKPEEKPETKKEDKTEKSLNTSLPSLSDVKDMIIEPKDENNSSGKILPEVNDFTEVMEKTEDKF